MAPEQGGSPRRPPLHCIPPLLTPSPLPHQGKLDEERQQVMLLRQNQEHVEDDLRGLRIRNREYEEGLYGLPQVCVNGRGRGLYGPPWEEEAQAWDGGQGGAIIGRLSSIPSA